jgi:hypothetical protein
MTDERSTMNPLRATATLTRGQQLVALYIAGSGVGLAVCVVIAPNVWYVMLLWALAAAVFVGDTRHRILASTGANSDGAAGPSWGPSGSC